MSTPESTRQLLDECRASTSAAEPRLAAPPDSPIEIARAYQAAEEEIVRLSTDLDDAVAHRDRIVARMARRMGLEVEQIDDDQRS